MSDGAYYLTGYAVECALKACIAEATQRHEFPDMERVKSSYSHKLENLVKVAGLERQLAELRNASPEFRQNWETVRTWTEQSRYGRHQPGDAESLLASAIDRRHGVVQWIRTYW
jgi:hypothetical protein